MLKEKTGHRVLHLINSQQRRGAEVFAAQLASCLQERGRFENLICSLHERGDDKLPVNGVTIAQVNVRDGAFDRVGLNPRLLSRLYFQLRKFQPDVIVAHGGDTLKYTVLSGLFYRRAATVYRNIGIASTWANSAAKVSRNRLLLKRIDAVASVSQAVKQDLIELYRLPPHKVTLIPNGVDTSDFATCGETGAREQVRRELGISQQEIVLISVGDLSPEKGYQDFLPLLGELGQSGAKYRFLLVGDGPIRLELQQRVEKLGLNSQVSLLGRRSDVPRLLAAADVFVLPSRTEGMPAVLIEAGLAGLPSVAFNVGGVSEVVEHTVTGLLAPAGDFLTLAAALTDLAEDSQKRAEQGAAARQRCLEQFDMRRIVGRYEELFLRVLGEARATV